MKGIFLFLILGWRVLFALDHKDFHGCKFYIDTEEEYTLLVFDGWSCERGSGATKVKARSPAGLELSLSVYPESVSFVPLIYQGADLSATIKKIKMLQPSLTDFFAFQKFEVISELADQSDESQHLVMHWSSEDACIIQDVICSNEKWYVISCLIPWNKDAYLEIHQGYFDAIVANLLADLEMRSILRSYYSFAERGKEEGEVPLYKSIQWPPQRFLENQLFISPSQ